MRKQRPKLISHESVPANVDLPGTTIRALVIDQDPCIRQAISEATHNTIVSCTAEPDVASALVRDDFSSFDIILVEDTADGAIDIIATHLQQMGSTVRIIALGRSAEFDKALHAMQQGAVDYIIKPIDAATMLERLVRAASLASTERRKASRLEQLKSICRRMNTARLDVTSQIDTLCNDLVHAYQDLTDQISHVTSVTEFSAIIRQDLDVEDLLRTSLEYFLRRLGPTNAAVFLASGSDDFSLGAYVNYDCSRETGEFLLDHLVDVITPLMVDDTQFRHFTTNEELTNWMGDDAAWLADSDLIVFPCRHNDECLAVFTIWRDVNTPFSQEQIDLLKALSSAFTKQLAHVVHVHHRHLPEDAWPDDDFDDNPDSLAA